MALACHKPRFDFSGSSLRQVMDFAGFFKVDDVLDVDVEEEEEGVDI